MLRRYSDAVREAGGKAKTQTALFEKVKHSHRQFNANIEALENAVAKTHPSKNALKHAGGIPRFSYPGDVGGEGPAADELEKIVDAELWPLPTYAEMLFIR